MLFWQSCESDLPPRRIRFMIDVALFLSLSSISKQRLEEEEAVGRWLDFSLLRGRLRQVGYHPQQTHLGPNALRNNNVLATDPGGVRGPANMTN